MKFHVDICTLSADMNDQSFTHSIILRLYLSVYGLSKNSVSFNLDVLGAAFVQHWAAALRPLKHLFASAFKYM